MKKKLAIIVIFLITIFLVTVFMVINKVKIKPVTKAQTIYKFGNSNAVELLTDDEISQVSHIFNGKMLYKDNPSCGFTESVSVKLNDSQIFCIACDTCPVIYWKNKDKYFKITKDEKKQLYVILNKHGFVFPCA